MALLVMDMTAATNFISTQAGDNSFALSPADSLRRYFSFKPLPMIPTDSLQTRRRRPIAPKPSLSLITMQKNGLELPSRQQDFSVPQDAVVAGLGLSTQLPSNDDANRTPLLSLSRSSSVYSSQSMISTCSTDSTETTISNIFELYTNLIEKVSLGVDTESIKILEPEDYHNEVAPLLKQRFRSEIPSAALEPASKEPVPYISSQILARSSAASQPQVLRSERSSRDVKVKRSDTISPLSAGEMGHHDPAYLQQIYVSMMNTSQTRPFSFTRGEQGIGRKSKKQSPVSPIDQGKGSLKSRKTPQRNIKSTKPGTSYRPAPLPLQPDMRASKRHNERTDISSQHMTLQPSRSNESLEMRDSWPELARYRRNKSADPVLMARDATSGRGHARGRSGSVEKDRQCKSEDVIPQHTRMAHPHTLPIEQSEWQVRGRREEDLRGDVRNTSMSDILSNASRNGFHTPEGIPMVQADPYRKRHTDGQSRREKKQRQLHLLSGHQYPATEVAEIPSRPTSASNKKQRQESLSPHRAIESIDYPVQQPKKYSFLSAFENARNSLTVTSAEKRREKLKESITVVGVTNLANGNNIQRNKSPR